MSTHAKPKEKPEAPKPWYCLSLSQQIVVGLIVGVIGGYVVSVSYDNSDAGKAAREAVLAWPNLIKDIFLHLIRMMVAPLVFASLVVGIAGHEDIKKVGRIAVKSLVYFEVLSGLALFVGLLLVNVIQPGAGMVISGISFPPVSSPRWLRATCCRSLHSRSCLPSRSPWRVMRENRCSNFAAACAM